MLLCTLTTLLLASLGAARKAADLDFTPAEAEAAECDASCQAKVLEVYPSDADNIGHDFDFDFYATPDNFSGSAAGDVLKFKPLNASARSIKAGTTVYLIMYTTVDLDGSLVPATGFVAFPYARGLGQYPCGGTLDGQGENGRGGGGNACAKFPLVAWAHGTTGLFAGCAPSNGPALSDYDTWQSLVAQGYAVVATDYAGLGNNQTTHKWLAFDAQATDVYYSVVAARSLFGHLLTREWMSAGHSQGGGTVWKLAESRYVRNDAAYLGTVAIAPATYAADMFLSHLTEAHEVGYLPFLAITVARALPDFKPRVLAPKMAARTRFAQQKQLCAAMQPLTMGLPRSELVDPAGLAYDTPYYRRWQSQHAPALGDPSPAPVLVIQGVNDSTVFAETTVQAVHHACGTGNDIQLRLYPTMEHTTVVTAAEPEWLAWLQWRFRGGEYSEGARCSESVKRPFDAKNLQTKEQPI